MFKTKMLQSASFGGNIFRGLIVCTILSTFVVVPTKSDEIQMNTATITFSDVTISTWNSDGKTAKFKDVVVAVVNGYCGSNYDKCALRFWNATRAFRTSDVTIASSHPKQVEKHIEIQFYVVLPSGNDIRKANYTILPKGTLDSILEANSSQIGNAVNAQVKSNFDGSTSKPKSDDTLDYIMIPVGFGLLIFVIVLACCLHFCHKRKLEQIKKEERRQFLLRQKSGNSKPQSPFQVPPVKQIPEVAVKPQQRQESRLYYENEQASDQDVKKENKTSMKDEDKNEDDEQQIDHIYDNIEDCYINQECEENVRAEEGSEESDQGRRNSKRRKKKKRRRRKKQGGSPQHEYDQDSVSDEDAPSNVLEDEDISSRLPPPRKLPPLRGQTTKM